MNLFSLLPVEITSIILVQTDVYICKYVCREWNEILREKSIHHYEEWLIQQGHLEVLKWLLDKGFELTDDVSMHAAEYGQLDTLKWLKSMNIVMTNTTVYASINGKHHKIMNWSVAKGFVDIDNALNESCIENHSHIVRWICETMSVPREIIVEC